jgi:hypothetical protein
VWVCIGCRQQSKPVALRDRVVNKDDDLRLRRGNTGVAGAGQSLLVIVRNNFHAGQLVGRPALKCGMVVDHQHNFGGAIGLLLDGCHDCR